MDARTHAITERKTVQVTTAAPATAHTQKKLTEPNGFEIQIPSIAKYHHESLLFFGNIKADMIAGVVQEPTAEPIASIRSSSQIAYTVVRPSGGDPNDW